MNGYYVWTRVLKDTEDRRTDCCPLREDEWMGGWMDGWMGGLMGGWMDGWMDGWVDGWMGERVEG